jgi:hypothetical protein
MESEMPRTRTSRPAVDHAARQQVIERFDAQLDAHVAPHDSAYLDGVYMLTARGTDGEVKMTARNLSIVDTTRRLALISVTNGATDVTLSVQESAR